MGNRWNKIAFMRWTGGIIIALIVVFSSAILVFGATEKPKRGGILSFAVGVEPPSYDGHRESTFGVMHPIAPHYSLLLKFDPEKYPKIIGDLALSWTISEDQKIYTFKIRDGVKFHDGSLLTSRDIKATYEKIIFPPTEVISLRKAIYSDVERIEVPDRHTVVFRLKSPSASFFASLASPWNYIYKADILAKNPRWYEMNIMGTGPFKFVEHVAGSHWVGKRNEDYFIKDHPYLDGYRAVFIKDTGARVAAIRGGRALIEFRGFTPSQSDELVRALGNKIQVAESPETSILMAVFNTEKKPFDDPRVRRAMTLALDRWEGEKVMARISNTEWKGGLLRPGSEFALSEADLTQMPGFSKDIAASRNEARRLLKEAGVTEGFSFELHNRTPPMPYEPTAVWFIDQWRQIGLNVTQKIQDLGIYLNDLKEGNFKVAVYSISDYTEDPDLQFSRFLSHNKSPNSYGRYQDPVLDDLYLKQHQAMNPKDRRNLCKQYQQRVLDEMVYTNMAFWWKRIIPYWTTVRGVKLLPSMFLNQDLSNIWLEKE